MSITVADKNLGPSTAYGYAKLKGYTGTEEEFAELMASYGTVAQQAADSAELAGTNAGLAAGSASAAEGSASAAANSATTAGGKAAEALASANEAGRQAGLANDSKTAAQNAKDAAESAAQEAIDTVVAAQGPGIVYMSEAGEFFVLVEEE